MIRKALLAGIGARNGIEMGCVVQEKIAQSKNPVSLKPVNIRDGKSLWLKMMKKRAKRSEKSGRSSCTPKGNKKKILEGLNLQEKQNNSERGTDRVFKENGIEKSKKLE